MCGRRPRADVGWLCLVLGTALGLATTARATLLLGGGKAAADCYGQLDVRGASSDDGRRVVCVDGDPACDLDGQCQGACTFEVAVCLNQANIPDCIAQPLRKQPKVSGALPLPSPVGAEAICGVPAPLEVTLKGRRADKPRTRKVRLVVVTEGTPRRDGDKFLLRCEPREGNCPATTSTTAAPGATTTTVATGSTTTTSTLPNVTLCEDDDVCQNSVCSQGICCSQTCEAPCNVCSSATGGICTPKGCGTPGVCEIGPGTCVPESGACDYPTAPDGTSCGDDAQICCGGSCCAAGEDCVDGSCQVPCSPLGSTCEDEAQCCQDGATFCAGSCCHDIEETCTSDAQCCSGHCRNGESCCVPPNSPCVSEGDCCLAELGACRNVPGGKACRCLEPGETCDTSQECCGLATCANGTCKAGSCLPPQSACISGFDCCWNGSTACDTNASGGFACCRGNGAACSTSGDCCGNTPCIGGTCCRAAGLSCNENTFCCPGTTCRDGQCLPSCPIGAFPCGAACCGSHSHCVAGTCQCVQLGGTCDPTNNLCCQQTETICPAANSFGNAKKCCRPPGGQCSTGADCCNEFFDDDWNRDTCGNDGLCGGTDAFCGSDADCIGGLVCVGVCYGRGAGFKLCKQSPECPPAQLCSQRRCIHPDDLPS